MEIVHGKKFLSAAAIVVVAQRTMVLTQQRHFWESSGRKTWYSVALIAMRIYNVRGCCCHKNLMPCSPHTGTAAFPKSESCRPMKRARCGLLFSAIVLRAGAAAVLNFFPCR